MRVLVTGSAGFIGFHLARALLDEGAEVLGFDGMTPYYDVGLKRQRHALLAGRGFQPVEALLEDPCALAGAVGAFRPEVIVHLAAQAGVRYSTEVPQAYVDSNITGTLAVLQAAAQAKVRHLLIASTSSVYGAGTAVPFGEGAETSRPVSIYAATKKAVEVLSHAHAALHGVPTTCFRFFTVYGPWGRPDMALFRFTAAILSGEPIQVYNQGRLWRDFTYVGDIVQAIRLLIDRPPKDRVEGDSLSPDAPWRVVNIGNGVQVGLRDFIAAVEAAVGRRAVMEMLPMQPGDVPATWADTGLLGRLTGYQPGTGLAEGVEEFVRWYRGWAGV